MNVARPLVVWCVCGLLASLSGCGGAQQADTDPSSNATATPDQPDDVPAPPPVPGDDGQQPEAPPPPDVPADQPAEQPADAPTEPADQPSAVTPAEGGGDAQPPSDGAAEGGDGGNSGRATYVTKPTSPAESKIAEGNEKLASGNFFDARQDFTAATQLDPQSATAWYNLGYVQWRSGAHEDAIGSLEKAIGINPTYSRAVFLVSVIHLRKGNSDAGLAVVDRALQSRPADAMLLNAKAMLLNGAKRFSESLQVCIKALHRDHDNPETLRILGDTYMGLNRRGLAKLAIDEAYSIYTAPAEEKKGAAPAKTEGQAPVKVTQYDKRLAKGSDGLRGTKAESIGKEYGLAHIFYIYGMMALHKEHYEEARGHFKKAVEYRPDYPEAWNNLGITWLVAKKGPEAVQSFHKALEYESDFFEARLNLGNAHRITLDPDRAKKAMAEYERAAKQRPNHPSPVFNIGILYLENKNLIADQVKRYDVAVEYFNKYKTLRTKVKSNDPVDDYIEEAKNMKKIAVDQQKAQAEAAKLEEENKLKQEEEARKKAEEEARAAAEAAAAAEAGTPTDAPAGDADGAPADGSDAPAPPPPGDTAAPPVPGDGGSDVPPPPPGDGGGDAAPPPPPGDGGGDAPPPPPPGDGGGDAPPPPPPGDGGGDAPPPPPPGDGGGDAPPPPPPGDGGGGDDSKDKKPDEGPSQPPAGDEMPPPPDDGGDEAPPPPPPP